ncbi:phosphoribosylanthranilate isomerase [Phyllobacterium sp. 0TCS1.6A]|uniref:phosphoribosylanthranilate isomerase n=1 Tax=Phyllobacterium sp. 0TCS1.6A TaxID=2995637 RepID=UPI0022645D7D|nr:phosphoribosylanthranilate isomerase [Phyllobacterium sp. 0TCS1.6A]MCX8293309.1 phosphoribosylanthranilate isomerase [Phyllobacterium sp. 0TCS1.6A]
MDLDVKICGLKTSEAVAAALEGGASHIGFIFFAKSPRNIAPAEAGRLRLAAAGRAKAVAVTVDATDAELDEIVAALQPDMLQLHGHESVERVKEIKRRYGLPVIKAMPLREPADLADAGAYAAVADRLLFDAKPPRGSELPGGNGISFDWKLLSALDGSVDYMLSGGINARNVGEALASTHARGVDVSSGVESSAGVKDVGLIREFFQAVAAARSVGA